MAFISEARCYSRMVICSTAIRCSCTRPASACCCCLLPRSLRGLASRPLLRWRGWSRLRCPRRTRGLLVQLVARRQPLGRAVTAGAFAAFFGPSIVAGATLMLEPWLGLFSLLALQRLTRQPATNHDSYWAGGFLAAATLIKAWEIIPLVAVIGWLALEHRRTDARNVAAAAAATFALVVSPFLVAAPKNLLGDVVWTQLRRPAAGVQGVISRVASIVGPHGPVAGSDRLAAAAALVAIVALAAYRLGRPGPARLGGLVVLIALLVFASGPSFYFHYGDFFTPWLALLLAGAVATRRRPRALAVILSGALAVGMVHQTFDVLRRQPAATVDLAKLHRLIGPGCVASEQVSLLLLADALDRPGCPSWLDPRGTALTMLPTPTPRDFYPFGFRRLDSWQHRYVRYLAAADQLLIAGAPCAHAEWTAATCQWILGHFTLIGTTGRAGPGRLQIQVWTRNRI